MSIEAGVVIDLKDDPIHWHLPPGRTSGFLPDHRPLWDVLWDNRARLAGVAHSHPWNGIPHPSGTDVSTFSAIELALGSRKEGARKLQWWIVTFDHVAVFEWVEGTETYNYKGRLLTVDPPWVGELRRLSVDPKSDEKGGV